MTAKVLVGSDAVGGLQCPICDADTSLWLRRGTRDLRRCDGCGFLWVPQGVVVVDGTTIYEQDPPIFFTEGNADYYLDESNLWNAKAKVAWVREFVPVGTELIDIGASFGHFTAAARVFWQVTGLEPSRAAARWAGEQLGVHLQVGSIYDERQDLTGRFDVATMWDVIEHLPDPSRALESVRRCLKREGTLCLTTPDAGSIVARLMGRHWHYLDLQQHIALFDEGNLTRLLEGAGFRIRAIRSFGRIYRVSYVRERIKYLARTSVVWRLLGAVSWPGLALAPHRLTINLGDVIGIAAEVSS